MEIEAKPEGLARMPLRFTWIPETGEVGGPNAEDVREDAEDIRRIGYISHTPTGLYTEADPLTTREGMAMLLITRGYLLPEELAGSLPVVPERLDEGDEPPTY